MNEMQHTHGGGFGTTRWSLVIHAAENPAALAELLSQYWGAMYAFCRRSGLSRDESADMVQEFMTQRLIAGELLRRADPARGRFRTFVKASLRNFLIDHARRRSAQRRSPAGHATIRLASLDNLDPSEQDDPSDAFDRQWAATLLSNVLEQVERDCGEDGLGVYWGAFERVVIRPMLGEAAAPPLADLAAELGVDSAARLSGMIQTVRRRFRRALRKAVEDTLEDISEAEDEVGVLRQFLRL
jgi:RNA polymerase sigma-70 factor (ECF subfamily)